MFLDQLHKRTVNSLDIYGPLFGRHVCGLGRFFNYHQPNIFVRNWLRRIRVWTAINTVAFEQIGVDFALPAQGIQ